MSMGMDVMDHLHQYNIDLDKEVEASLKILKASGQVSEKAEVVDHVIQEYVTERMLRGIVYLTDDESFLFELELMIH